MQVKLGRCLKSFEHVHHINGIKNDNRIENLQLIAGKHHAEITQFDVVTAKRLVLENKALKKEIAKLQERILGPNLL